MGYEANIVNKLEIEYGNTICGFRGLFYVFIDILNYVFKISFWNENNCDGDYDSIFEIDNEEIEKLKLINIKEVNLIKAMDIIKKEEKDITEEKAIKMLENLKQSLIEALNTEFSRKNGRVRIEWF